MKCDLLGINHSTGSMIDVKQRLENDIPGADQVLLNAAEQVHFTSIPFTRGSRQAISAAGGLIKEHRIQHIHGFAIIINDQLFLSIMPFARSAASKQSQGITPLTDRLPRPSASQ